jgi:hypothetical protein
MKQCTKCKEMKSENKFCKRKRHKDGLSCWCKECESAYARERYDRMRKRQRRYLRYEERHRVYGGVKQKICSRCKKWRPEAKFYKKLRHKDGLSVWCKECSDKATNACRRNRTAAAG